MDNMLTMLGMESCKPTNTPMVRKESVANDDQEMLEGSEAETYRFFVGILMYIKRHRFDLHYAAKWSVDAWRSVRGSLVSNAETNRSVVKVSFTRQLFVRVSSCGLAKFKECWDTP